MPRALERTWEVKTACGHTMRHVTFVGDFDYEAHVREFEVMLCTVCRYELDLPLDQAMHSIVTVRLVPNEEER